MKLHSTGLTLAFLSLLLVAGCGGGGSDGNAANVPVDEPGEATGPNLAPFLGCVKGVVTAGGARILVLWNEATDDKDASSDLRYQVFLSATTGGHDFASPVATSAPGATSLQLTSADSSLIAEGAEVFVVVRAEFGNRVDGKAAASGILFAAHALYET